MQRLEISGAVRPIYGSLGVKGLVEFRFKAPPVTTSSSITTHTPSGQRNCASWASQLQKSVTLLPCPGGRNTKPTKGHVVALDQKKLFVLTLWNGKQKKKKKRRIGNNN